MLWVCVSIVLSVPPRGWNTHEHLQGCAQSPQALTHTPTIQYIQIQYVVSKAVSQLRATTRVTSIYSTQNCVDIRNTSLRT